ncbi:MAG: outer membrane beta-barrel protein, partial [Saprospiraceae bacterium]
LSPNIGYYFMDNLGIGLALNVSGTKLGRVKGSSFGAGPWLRYYVYKGVFAHAGYNFSSVKITTPGVPDLKFTGSNINLGIGYSHFLNNSIALEPKLYYDINSSKLDGDSESSKDNTFGLSIGFQIFFNRN